MEFVTYKLYRESEEVIFTLRRSDEVPPRFPCPVCGALHPVPSYANSDSVNGTGAPSIAQYAIESYDICPVCSTQYGVDDFFLRQRFGLNSG